ncbi:MAG TPA: DUF2974 domain-containing protein [Clostridiaceae bacterium]|nr:DUF2974 domain-containing protein [Clostridiaceae bacterium]
MAKCIEENTNPVLDTAAKLELSQKKLYDMLPGTNLKEIGLDKYELVDSREFDTVQNNIKAITIRGPEPDTDLHVHYFGTGDGNWKYNAAAYGAGPPPSEMQKWAAEYFDSVLDDYYVGKSQAKVFISGHSQGGNNAQFATMESRHNDLITECITIDGPGFSHGYVNDLRQRFGDAAFDERRSRIWAYNGENDFVSPLGQQSIILDGQTKYIKYYGPKLGLMMFHQIEGKFDKENNINFVDKDKPFRKMVRELLRQVDKMPVADQARAAELVMMLCEDIVGDGPIKSNMSMQDFNELKDLLAPFLVSFLTDADSTDSVIDAIVQLFELEEDGARSIVALLKHLGEYPKEECLEIIQAILACVDYENGEFIINFESIPEAIRQGVPAALDHLDNVFTDWFAKNPLKYVGGVFVVSTFIALHGGHILVIAFLAHAVDNLITEIDKLLSNPKYFKEMVVKTLTFLKKAILALSNIVSDFFNAGKRYVNQYPYFKADTDKLVEYARRIQEVNKRLNTLDNNLRSLYYQVRMVDLFDILLANLITRESRTLRQVVEYLENTAERLNAAEKQAERYLS